ncbi:MAG: flagellar biosynthesis anti-sigma factor FlgM [Lachnospiraceae bacterium]
MRIDAMAEISQIYQSNGTKRTTGTSKVASRDTVEISGFGKELQVAKKAIAQTPDVREDKVQELKTSMANGTYNVPMGALADKLLNGFSL